MNWIQGELEIPTMISLWRGWLLAAPVAASVCFSAQPAAAPSGPGHGGYPPIREPVQYREPTAHYASSTAADDDFIRTAVGLRLGTLGLGVEAAVGIGDYINVRIVGHNTTIKYKDTLSDVRYDLDLNLRNAGLILDFNTAQSGFRLSGGVFYNGNDADGDATPRTTTNIGGVPFTPSQIGTITGDISTDPLAYYFGIGFGNPVDPEMRVTVTLDIGVLIYASSPEVKLRANGSLSDTDLFQEALREEERDIEDSVIQWWPVIAIGISYQF